MFTSITWEHLCLHVNGLCTPHELLENSPSFAGCLRGPWTCYSRYILVSGDWRSLVPKGWLVAVGVCLLTSWEGWQYGVNVVARFFKTALCSTFESENSFERDYLGRRRPSLAAGSSKQAKIVQRRSSREIWCLWTAFAAHRTFQGDQHLQNRQNITCWFIFNLFRLDTDRVVAHLENLDKSGNFIPLEKSWINQEIWRFLPRECFSVKNFDFTLLGLFIIN